MAAYTQIGYSVADIAALKAIPPADRPAFAGALVSVVSTNQWFEFDPSGASGGITPDSGAGRWYPLHRETLIADRTYYVRTDGSDNNEGLANTAGGAFLTIQKAIDTAATLDLNGFNLKVKIGNGTYTQSVTLKEVVGYSSAGSLVIEGDTTTPSNVVINVTNNNCFLAKNINSAWDIQGVTMQTTTGGSAIRVENASVRFGSVAFGACAIGHIIQDTSARVECIANYSITGSTLYHWFSNANSVLLCSNKTITLTGTPNFGILFARASLGGIMNVPVNTFSGSATGIRYSVLSNAAIDTAGAGDSYFPGNAGGTTDGFGAYF